jgi:ligand-binding sensor domain-containing protein
MRINVTVAEGGALTAQQVAEQLRSHGMEVESVLEGVGIIIGSAPDDSRAALESLEGVASVDEEIRFQLPDPNEDIQ